MELCFWHARRVGKEVTRKPNDGLAPRGSAKGDKSMPIRHIVLINWKKHVLQDQIDDWIKFCDRIPEECPMVHNWSSGPCITGPDPEKPSSHQFAIMFDLGSDEEWIQYLKHPYPEL